MTAANVMDASTWSPLHERLPHPYRPEGPVIEALLAELVGKLDWWAVRERARPWLQAVRAHPAPFWAVESLLQEYPLSSAEGRALIGRLITAALTDPALPLGGFALLLRELTSGHAYGRWNRLFSKEALCIARARVWIAGEGAMRMILRL